MASVQTAQDWSETGPLTDPPDPWRLQRKPLPNYDSGVAQYAYKQQTGERGAAKAEVIMPAKLLQRKLGKATFRLWAVMLGIRNRSCETHPTIRGLARMTQHSEHSVERSLARLRAFKLVMDWGFLYRQVPCTCKVDYYHEHKIYGRTVYGWLVAPADINGDYTVLVPRATLALVKEAAGQGGARPGAGRPKGCVDFNPRKSRKRAGCETVSAPSLNSNRGTYRYQVLSSSEEPSGSSSESRISLSDKPTNTTLTTKEVVGTPARPHLELVVNSIATKPSPPSEESPVATTIQPSEQAAPAAPDEPHTPAPPMAAVADGVVVDLFALTGGKVAAQSISFGGGYTGPTQRYTSEDMRVASELANQIQVFRVPAPPKMNLEASEDAQLCLLGAAYRAAFAKVFRWDFWTYRKAQPAKERAALLEGAQALAAEKITPTAWALFSMSQWKSMGKKEAPSVRWVWKAERIHKHARWCHESVGTLNGAKPVTGQTASRTLIRRLGELRRSLGWGKPTDAVVSSVLPALERRALLAQQAHQYDLAQAETDRRIRSGEWVWG